MVKQDREADVGKVAKAAGDVREGLDGGVEAFGRAVGDGATEPGEVSW